MTALEYFRLVAAEYAATADATVNVWLEIAADEANTSCLTDAGAARAQALYAAHLLKTAELQQAGSGGSAGGAVGPLIREKEGDLERQYGTPATPASTASKADSWLGSTGYGQQYSALTAGCGAMGILTRVG